MIERILEAIAKRIFAVLGLYTRQGQWLVMKEIHKNIAGKTLKTRTQQRDQIDLLRSRLGLLEGKDKVMMTMYVENGNSFRQIARLLGVSETCIARRIHRLTHRLIDGQYIACLRNREKFTDDQMDVAKDYFLKGLSMRKIAEKRNWSRYRVLRAIREIRNLIQTGA